MNKLQKLGLILFIFMMMQPLSANEHLTKAQNKFKTYVNDVVEDVKAAERPAEKRKVLDNSFQKMFKTLNTVEKLPGLSSEETQFIDHFRKKFQTYQAELNGIDGFDRVADSELNNFTDYMQQDLEQAKRTITISLTTLLLIIIIVLLVA